MASKCRKFVPNIFNKTKCQTCFGSKEQHSAEALENNKASRKVSKCGYLFVAPGYDFNNPLDKTKRWQRRFFVLYDDGELAYSVDENPDTVPQGVIDMNKCTDVKDASGSTSHSNSMAIITPEKTTYIKGNSKEEIQWWHDVLVVYPRSMCKPKQRRFTVPSYSFLNKENLQMKSQTPTENNTDNASSNGRIDVDKVKGKDQAFSTYRGVRSMKHNKADKHHQEGLRKSSSLHDLSSEDKDNSLDTSRFLSRSGDRLDSSQDSELQYSDSARLLSGYGSNPYVSLSLSQSLGQSWKSPISNSKPLQASNIDSSSNSSISSAPSQASASEGATAGRRGSFDEKTLLKTVSKSRTPSERSRLHRERSASMKSFPTGLTLPKIPSSVGSASVDRLLPRSESSSRSGDSGHQVNENETDELKMAKSSELQTVSRSTPPPPSPTRQAAGPGTKFEDLMYMKKGWLIKMGTSEKAWKKHWFVLTGNSLRYYKDAKAEETNNLDGRIDLSSCYEISELQIQRNYGFKIKTRNGEYILSAMTSGIRSNWMKAIRLCMDLQNSNKNKQSKASPETSLASSRANDDMQIDSSSSSSRSSENSRGKDKKEYTRNIRRHYSDVNPGNISKMLSIKGINLDNSKSLSQSLSPSSQSSSASSKEPSVDRDAHTEHLSQASHKDLGAVSKQGKYEQFWSGDGVPGIPFRRFVEGSDSHGSDSSTATESKSGDKSDDEERKRRAKSPSAKIKERSRAKSPKLHSPPPGHDQENKFSFRPSTGREEDKISVSSEDIDLIDHDDNIHLDTEDNLPSTMSSTGETLLVDLLENEVESLKERLEHTQQELAKSHDSNNDLKTKLQTVVREKDTTQLNTMKRQLKDTKDTIQRQKLEIDQLKSKLDMSISKLTGTEKALSEALKDVKQEKDKFLKVTTEYNRKVRVLEGQLKDITQRMERYHENSLTKDKENRKLDLELKQSQQKLRDHEREVLKLKAVEHEYRQMKVKFDETEKIMARLRSDLKEKDEQFKKMEVEYEEQFENMMQDFSKERDDIEQHLEDLKSQLLEAQRKTDLSEQVSSNVADILREKDEIIAQLEEKVIESETKLVEVNDESTAAEDENAELHSNIELLQEEIDNSLMKIKELEKSLSHYQSQIQRLEKENASIRKHMDDLRKENTELSERIDVEKSDVTNLVEDNDSLKSNVKDLEFEVHNLHEKLKEVVSGTERTPISPGGTSEDILHTIIIASEEMNDIHNSMHGVKGQLEHILSNHKGDQKTSLAKTVELLGDLDKRCENITKILKEGGGSDKIEKQTTTNLTSANASGGQELEVLKRKNEEVCAQADRSKKELEEMKAKVSKLKTDCKDKEAKARVLETTYKQCISDLNKRVDDMATKNKIALEKSSKGRSRQTKDPEVLSSELQEQITELEEKVEMVEKVLQTHDLSSSSIEAEIHAENDGESETETEDSDDYSDSEGGSDDSDTETQDESAVLEGSDGLLGKLKEMKNKLQLTNKHIRELTSDIGDFDAVDGGAEMTAGGEIRQTLLKCGEKVDKLTVRLSDGIKSASTEMPKFSDCTWAFQKCINRLKEKITDVSIIVHEHDDLNSKELKTVQEKIGYMVQYVEQIDKLGENDWDIAGKIAKQELKFQHLLSHREKATKKSTLKYEDRLQLYADKLAFEAMILGQMAILIQQRQMGATYKDNLLTEIHNANLQILELERKIDTTSREINPSEQEKDLISSYAAMLAEKIVLEGQLASNAMVQDLESSENMEVLSALNVDETPTVLAMEIFLRSQLDSSVSSQLQKFAENMDNMSSFIVTKALLQGEITHALNVMKQKFRKTDSGEDLESLLKRERQFAFEQLQTRHQLIVDLLNETEPLVMTTLIQLIEYTQGPSSPTLGSVCDKMSGIVHSKVKELEDALPSADSNTKTKIKHIISHLHSELEDAISIFREEYHCYVQTASPDINPNVLKFSADTVASDLAGMFIQKAVIDGTFAYVSDIFMSSPDVSVSQIMTPVSKEEEGLSELAKSLGQILLTEAANKQKLVSEIRSITPASGDELASSITDLVGVIPDLEAYPQSFDAYAATLVREAMFQSQLTYTTYKLKLQYHRQLRDIKLKMEAGEKVVLPSEISKEAESDIQASMTTFEEILNNKYQDEIAVLSLLESQIGQLKSLSAEKSCSKCKTFEANIKQLDKSFQNEVSLAQERQNVHIDVLHQEVNNVILRVDKFLEDYEKDREGMIADYEERIATLQDEFDIMRINHEDELEQSKQDIMTAVSAIRATEEKAELNNMDTLKNHNKQLMRMAGMCKELLTDISANLGSGRAKEELHEKISSQLANLTTLEEDPSFTVVPLPLSSPDSPTTPPLTQEPPKLDRSLTAEKSDENVDKLLERSQHEHEMEQLKREKEAALADEIKDTKAALDAMRKAYEEELAQEKDKYRNALKTMFTDNYVEDIRRRQDLEMEKLREELKQMSMHYESNSEDYKLLEDRLQRTKTEYQTHINQLSKSNEHLTQLVNTEIEQLKEFIQTRSTGRITGSATLEEELYDAQIMVRVKDTELQKLRLQVKNLENSLERTTEEQRYTMTQYLQSMKKSQELQAKLKEAVLGPCQDSTSAEDQKNVRALRRNPSFHQRARSPSPETSPRKDNTSEHHSRDSHRRSRGHLSAKDLKRSKSSPSLPYVFEAKGTGSSGLASNQQRAQASSGVSRRDSGKYSKSPKK